MRARTRHFCILIAAQSLCVAAGLWMQCYLLRSSWGHHAPRQAHASGGPPIAAMLPAALVTCAWTVGLLTMTTYLATRRSQETLERERVRSTHDKLVRTQALARTRDAIIFALAKLAGFRDHETGGHLERISNYATLLASALRGHPRYAAQVTPAFIRLIGLSSVLHDIGKVGIEDAVLRKRGPLSGDERARMQSHTVLAGDCLGEIAQRMGDSGFLRMAREIALGHHEHWNGGGYPNGRRGEQIPLAARIVAIVDVYDAMSMPRVYKGPRPHSECVAAIRNGAGAQFDPELVKIWLTVEPRFHEIARLHLESLAEQSRTGFVPAQSPGPPCETASASAPAAAASCSGARGEKTWTETCSGTGVSSS